MCVPVRQRTGRCRVRAARRCGTHPLTTTRNHHTSSHITHHTSSHRRETNQWEYQSMINQLSSIIIRITQHTSSHHNPIHPPTLPSNPTPPLHPLTQPTQLTPLHPSHPPHPSHPSPIPLTIGLPVCPAVQPCAVLAVLAEAPLVVATVGPPTHALGVGTAGWGGQKEK